MSLWLMARPYLGMLRLNSHAILGGFTLVHQFYQIGQLALLPWVAPLLRISRLLIMEAAGPPNGMALISGHGANGISAEDIRLKEKPIKSSIMNLRLEDAIDQMKSRRR